MKESVRSKNVFEYLQEQGSLTIGEFNVMAEGYPSDFSFVPYGFVPEVPIDECLDRYIPLCDINANVQVYSDRIKINNTVLPYVKFITRAEADNKIDVCLINLPGLLRPITSKKVLGKKLIEEKIDGKYCKFYLTETEDILFYRKTDSQKINSLAKYFTVLCLMHDKLTGDFCFKILLPESLFVVIKKEENIF